MTSETSGRAIGLLTAAAERKKRSLRSSKKRKVEEAADLPAPELSPIVEVEEEAPIPQCPPQEEIQIPVPAWEDRPAPAEGTSRSSDLEPAEDDLIWSQRLPRVKMTGSVIADPQIAREVMKAICVPADRWEVSTRPLQITAEAFGTGFAQINSIFQSLMEEVEGDKDRLQKVRTELDEARQAAEEERSRAEVRFQALRSESAREVKILQEEIARLENVSKKSAEDLLRSTEAYNTLRARCRNSEKKLDRIEKQFGDAGKIAIAKFMESEDYALEIADASLPVFFEGFDDCKEKIAKIDPKFDLSQLVSKLGTREEVLGKEGEDEPEQLDLPKQRARSKAESSGKGATPEAPSEAAPEDLPLPDV